MLRLWQEGCVKAAINKYLSGQRHFLCQATPGAGKTVMAAELAKALIDMDKIDLVLCFSPSISVAANMKSTFAWKLDCQFSGSLGETGGSYTYHSLKHQSDGFWKTIRKHRVLAVFDEIHHCAADEYGRSNSWGEQIVSKLQHEAEYTLALTGTPWRSDKVSIALASYTNPQGQIICDYQYSLREAIHEKVCRVPKLVLVDNDNLTVTEGAQRKSFSSIVEMLKQSRSSYQDIIYNEQALGYLISLGCQRLATIRQVNDNAGGLIVASSVKHAEKIQSMLVDRFKQTATIVTYQHDSPLQTIDNFRDSDSQWIVSVGMISEGTDIPRLQVCCHLSAVKTELYFRQVLGRILRTNGGQEQEAWLYTFAEESLVGFAERIEQDIPETCRFINLAEVEIDNTEAELTISLPGTSLGGMSAASSRAMLSWENFGNGEEFAEFSPLQPEYLLMGTFKQRVIAAFS
ncbi:TPA: DEAD/DEAH box helicase [Vibrio parahaemolyticus]